MIVLEAIAAVIAIVTFGYFLSDRYLKKHLELQFSTKQVGFARLRQPTNKVDGHFLMMIYGMDFVNQSPASVTLKEVFLRCNLDGNTETIEPFSATIGVVRPKSGRQRDAIELRHEHPNGPHFIFMGWRNVRQELAKRKPIEPGGALSAEGMFILPTKSYEEVRNLKEFEIILRDFSGRESVQKISMEDQWFQAADKTVFENRVFINDGENTEYVD